MSLCDKCIAECEHDFCDGCDKCHLCGAHASAPAAPMLPPGPGNSPFAEHTTPLHVIAPPAFNDNDYNRYLKNQRFFGQASAQVH